MCFGGTKTEIVIPQPPPPSAREVRRNELTDALIQRQLQDAGLRTVQDELTSQERQSLESEQRDLEGIVSRRGGGDPNTKGGTHADRLAEVKRQLEAGTNNQVRLEEIPERTLEDIEADIASGEITQSQGDRELEDQTRATEDREFQDLLQDRIREELLRDPNEGPSDATKALVGETFNAAEVKGNQEINRFATEFAGSRGFEKTDSPVANAAFRAKTDLSTGLRSAEAGALLNVGHRQQLFAANVLQFQESLRQQAVNNRANIAGQSAGVAAQSGNLRSSFFKPQVLTTETEGFPLGQVAQGIGSALGGFFQR